MAPRPLEESATPLAWKALPEPALAPYVRHIRAVPAAVVGAHYVRLPDGEVELFVPAESPGSGSSVTGTRESPLDKRVSVRSAYTYVVRFRAAGAYPFFGVPLSELTDEIVPLRDLWRSDAGELERAFEKTAGLEERMASIQSALATRMRGAALFEPPAALRVRRAVRWMHERAQLPSVTALASELCMSERQLRRAFAEVVGVNPRTYGRIVRFQRALRAARKAASPEWRTVAASAGYFDQAHMIAEFRALAGVTPVALHARERQRVAP